MVTIVAITIMQSPLQVILVWKNRRTEVKIFLED